MTNKPETVPCGTCGEPTSYTGTKRCNNCWEVESRLQDYLRSPKGASFVRQLLEDMLAVYVIVAHVSGHGFTLDRGYRLKDASVSAPAWLEFVRSSGTHRIVDTWERWLPTGKSQLPDWVTRPAEEFTAYWVERV